MAHVKKIKGKPKYSCLCLYTEDISTQIQITGGSDGKKVFGLHEETCSILIKKISEKANGNHPLASSLKACPTWTGHSHSSTVHGVTKSLNTIMSEFHSFFLSFNLTKWMGSITKSL